MQTQYFKNFSAHPFVKPLNDLMALNAKTMQRLSGSITSTEFLKVRKPEELLHSNMTAFINSTHTVLDYVQDVFHIFEQNLLEQVHHNVGQAQAAVKPVVQAASSSAVNVLKKSKPTVRREVSKSEQNKKTVSAKSKVSEVKKKIASVNATKKKVSQPPTVQEVHGAGVMKHKARKPSSILKNVNKNTIKESSGLSKGSEHSNKPVIHLGSDNKNDQLK